MQKTKQNHKVINTATGVTGFKTASLGICPRDFQDSFVENRII